MAGIQQAPYVDRQVTAWARIYSSVADHPLLLVATPAISKISSSISKYY